MSFDLSLESLSGASAKTSADLVSEDDAIAAANRALMSLRDLEAEYFDPISPVHIQGKPDLLYMDPDTGDIVTMIFGPQGYREATALDVLDDYVRRMEPVEEACEFDVPRF